MTLEKGKYFIVSTGTDAGKTFLVSEICKKLRAKNIACDAIKPVASGFNEDDLHNSANRNSADKYLQSDCAKILQSLGKEFSIKNVENITPWRFNAALAPSIAAKIENREINFDELQNFCRKKILQMQNGFLFIEGAGGVMTPLSDDKTFLDLIAVIKIPVILLAQNYLGAISHTLCTFEALRSRAVAIERIIINDHQNQNREVKISDTVAEIARLSGVETVALEDFLNNL